MLATSVRTQSAFPGHQTNGPCGGFLAWGTSQLVGILGASSLHIGTCLWAEAALLGRLAGCTGQACFLQGIGDGIFHSGKGGRGGGGVAPL